MYRKTIVLFALAAAILFIHSTDVSAKITPTTMPTLVPTQAPEETKVEKIEYTLPYPGILPDHPLYVLKNIRDKIMDFLIRDPLKRIEFNILMADKRLNMGIILSDQSKHEKAGSIITEAEQFMNYALAEGKKAKDQGREVRSDIIKKLEHSLAKHKEVINELLQKGPESVKKGYEKAVAIIQANQELVPSLSK